jgi:hypothetical protein
MKGYPKNIATKQDFLNLLIEKEYREQALADLKAIADLDDSTVLRTISISDEKDEAVTEKIENPMPLWKIKGFESREEVLKLAEV